MAQFSELANLLRNELKYRTAFRPNKWLVNKLNRANVTKFDICMCFTPQKAYDPGFEMLFIKMKLRTYLYIKITCTPYYFTISINHVNRNRGSLFSQYKCWNLLISGIESVYMIYVMFINRSKYYCELHLLVCQ